MDLIEAVDDPWEQPASQSAGGKHNYEGGHVGNTSATGCCSSLNLVEAFGTDREYRGETWGIPRGKNRGTSQFRSRWNPAHRL